MFHSLLMLFFLRLSMAKNDEATAGFGNCILTCNCHRLCRAGRFGEILHVFRHQQVVMLHGARWQQGRCENPFGMWTAPAWIIVCANCHQVSQQAHWVGHCVQQKVFRQIHVVFVFPPCKHIQGRALIIRTRGANSDWLWCNTCFPTFSGKLHPHICKVVSFLVDILSRCPTRVTSVLVGDSNAHLGLARHAHSVESFDGVVGPRGHRVLSVWCVGVEFGHWTL